jgi:hypothetical protein
MVVHILSPSLPSVAYPRFDRLLMAWLQATAPRFASRWHDRCPSENRPRRPGSPVVHRGPNSPGAYSRRLRAPGPTSMPGDLELIRIDSGEGVPINRSKAASRRTLARWRLSAQPTPKTRSLKSRSECGFQYAPRIRSHVGGRKSYGTRPNTRPSQVRWASGLASSVATAATTSATTASLIVRRSLCNIRILELKRSPQ